MSNTRTGWRWHPSFSTILAASVLIRVVLILYSEWHDAQPGVVVKYTDVDYRVFTDAARYIVRGGSEMESSSLAYRNTKQSSAKGVLGNWVSIGDPYDRDTYRYTPLLALLMTPNILFSHSFGKYVFAACDIVVGILLRRILIDIVLHKTNNAKDAASRQDIERRATLYTSIHLLNPLVFSISTRGSSESIIGALVILTLYFALSRRWDAAAFMLGVATHWKIFPVIYAASVVPFLATRPEKKNVKQVGVMSSTIRWVTNLVNRETIRFGIISGGTFMVLNFAMYLIWGEPFLEHSLLYHLHRLDHRHNFSPFFLPIYLSYPPHATHASYSSYLSEIENLSTWSRIVRSPLASFVPQMSAALGTGLILAKSASLGRLPFVWFVQTAVFVTFNKVCTSQYFLWYLTLLPLLLPSLRLSRTGILLLGLWTASQALWLSTGYELEFLGKNVYFKLWVWSVIFLMVNVWAIGVVMKGFKGT